MSSRNRTNLRIVACVVGSLICIAHSARELRNIPKIIDSSYETTMARTISGSSTSPLHITQQNNLHNSSTKETTSASENDLKPSDLNVVVAESSKADAAAAAEHALADIERDLSDSPMEGLPENTTDLENGTILPLEAPSEALKSEKDTNRIAGKADVAVFGKGIENENDERSAVLDQIRSQRGRSRIRDQEQSILLVSLVFGEAAANKKYLRMFVESVRHSGVDLAIIGDHRPPFELPQNVQFVQMEWRNLAHAVFDSVFDGNKAGDLEQANAYKVNDIKPLIAFMWPELFEGYSWWGYCDNDILLGRVKRVYPNRVLAKHDVLNPLGGYSKTWGPFTLLRNNNTINELMLRAQDKRLIASQTNYCLDEWGQCEGSDLNHFNSSISGLIENFEDTLGIRTSWHWAHKMWDGDECPFAATEPQGKVVYRATNETCAKCIFRNGRLLKSWISRDGKPMEREVLLCHYQYSKHALESSLNNSVMDGFKKAGEFQVSIPDGYQPYAAPVVISENHVVDSKNTNTTDAAEAAKTKKQGSFNTI